MNQRKSILSELSYKEFESVYKDFKLIYGDDYQETKNNKRELCFHFVVDPHELIDYCFPFNPNNPDQNAINIDIISDQQLALYDIFYEHKHAPLILKDHEFEVEILSSQFAEDLSKIYEKTKMIETFLRLSDLDIELLESHAKFKPFEKDENYLKKTIRDNLSQLLAVGLGIVSIGTQRLRELTTKRLERENEACHKIPHLSEILKKYSTSEHLRDMTESILIEYRDRLEEGKIKQKDYLRIKNNIPRDVAVVDKLIHINKEYQSLNNSNSLNDGIQRVFLFLSDASSTKEIFKYLEDFDKLPLLNNRKYNFWRRRRQIFAFIISNIVEKNKNETNYSATEKRLIQLKKLVRYKDIKGSIPQPLQEMYENFMAHKLEIDHEQNQFENLSLLSQVSKFQNFKKQIEEFDFDKKDTKNKKSSIIIETIREIYKNNSYVRDAENKISASILNLAYKNKFGKTINQTFSSEKRKDEFENSVYELFPFCINFQNPELIQINDLLKNFIASEYSGDFSTREKQLNQLKSKIYSLTFNIDNELSPEKQLMRIQMEFLQPDDFSLIYADSYYRFSQKQIDNDSEYSNYIADFAYQYIWLLRKLKKFEEAEIETKKLKKKYKDDPRFWHAQVINLIGILYKSNKNKSEIKENKIIERVIRGCKNALRLYEDHFSNNKSEEKHYLIATIKCHYAYTLSMSENSNDVLNAHKIIQSLKLYPPPPRNTRHFKRI